MPIRNSLFPPNALCTAARITTGLAIVALITACASDQRPTAPNEVVASRNRVPATEGLASPAWQLTARKLVSQASYTPIQATRVYPILGVAQYLAVQRAEGGNRNDENVGGNVQDSNDDETNSGNGIGSGGRKRLETDRGAVAGASVVTLSFLFPASAPELEAMVTAQANAGRGRPHPAFAAGEAIGRAVGAQIVARAMADNFTSANNAVPLVGPGYWTSSADPPTPVDGGQFKAVVPWFLTSSSQFRPDPHPAFGSPAFNAALAEIRHISDTRTPEQVRIATFWALSKTTPTTSGFWLAVPTDSGWVTQHGLSERETTHLYALLSATMFDAQIGCWDEKLTSWLIRPWKADPAITVVAAVGKPNHPSYPSGHSCLSSSAASVLTKFFPEKRTQLDAMVVQAGLSRMYGGIHYAFDIAAGQTLGRNVAAFTIAADASGNSVLTAH
jgi:membrane-associated phospholipid phosphatase